jgi:hypothetical protein
VETGYVMTLDRKEKLCSRKKNKVINKIVLRESISGLPKLAKNSCEPAVEPYSRNNTLSTIF